MQVKNSMKKLLPRFFVTAAVVSLILFAGPNLLAGASAPGDLLRQAYATLSAANHDYKGHRVAAMKHVQAAGKLLGVELRGHGRGHEQQGDSDAQLRAAQNLLEQARPALSGKPLKRVNRAIHEISVALNLR
jgi:hypothetical protein